jgi:hypothetical protein
MFFAGNNLNAYISSPGRFSIARCTLTSLISAEFIFFKLLTAKLPNFEFPPYRIVLFGRYGPKGIIFILIALLGIPIRLSPL